MLLPIGRATDTMGRFRVGVYARVAFLFKECTVVGNPPAPPCCKLSAYNESFLFVKWEAQKNAQRDLYRCAEGRVLGGAKGLKEEAQKNAQRHWEAQFQRRILGCTRHKIKTGLLSKQFGLLSIFFD
jgi:hypothetical protein